jgi:hypothetical protein
LQKGERENQRRANQKSKIAHHIADTSRPGNSKIKRPTKGIEAGEEEKQSRTKFQ